MTGKSDEFLKKLLPIFRMEAGGHLQAISTGLLALGPGIPGHEQASTIETIFRETHSLKGAARAVNLSEMEAVCQSLENVFSMLKGGSLAISSTLIDLMLQIVDKLTGILANDSPSVDASGSHLSRLTQQLDTVAATQPFDPATAETGPRNQANHGILPPAHRAFVKNTGDSTDRGADATAEILETTASVLPAVTRVSTERFDSVMRQIEELLQPRLAFDQRVKELEEATATVVAWKKQWMQVQPAIRFIDRHPVGSGRDI